MEGPICDERGNEITCNTTVDRIGLPDALVTKLVHQSLSFVSLTIGELAHGMPGFTPEETEIIKSAIDRYEAGLETQGRKGFAWMRHRITTSVKCLELGEEWNGL